MKGVYLNPNDRICFGKRHVFLFKNKNKEVKMRDKIKKDSTEDPITFDFAIKEIQRFDE